MSQLISVNTGGAQHEETPKIYGSFRHLKNVFRSKRDSQASSFPTGLRVAAIVSLEEPHLTSSRLQITANDLTKAAN